MAVKLSQKVTKLLNDLGEDVDKFKKKAKEMVETPGASYYKTTLNKTTYYMRYRKAGADYEVYDYGFDKPK